MFLVKRTGPAVNGRGLFIFCFLLANTFIVNQVRGQFGDINTIAGNGTAGFSGDGGLATAAKLNGPSDVFKDASGNIYIADNGNNRIRKINTAGIISTIAGTGTASYTGDGGLATAATLNRPNRVFVDGTGNVYIADQDNNVIRMINTSGIISTIAGTGTAGFSGDGGLATSAKLSSPTGVAVDASGNVFISDLGNNRIRKIDATGIISTYAGGGTAGFTTDGVAATSISLCAQQYVSVDNAGTIYITNHDCWHFLKVTTAGLIYNVAGAEAASYTGDCGPADSADVDLPYGITPDNLGNIYLCPRGNVRVRRVNSLGYISTVAGTGVSGFAGDGGLATNAEISNTIYGIYADVSGDIYFADMGNNRIRSFTSSPYADTLTMCVGATDTLHDSTVSGTWLSGDIAVATVNSVTGVVTGIAAGTAIITYNNIACPELFLINVLSPVVNLGPDTIICGGGSVTLASEYTYTVTPVTYLWSTGSTTPTITATTAGTYWLSVTEDGCVAPTDTIHLTFGPAVVVNLGDDTSFCAGNTITLQSSDTPYVTPAYLWNTGSTAASINVSVSGNYWLQVTSTGGCKGADTVAITVNPIPPVPVTGSNAPVCSGASLDLTAADTTGASYSWAGPSGFTSVLQNPIISPVNTSASGVYSVIATLNGCVSASASETIVIDSTPVAPAAGSNTPVCSGNTLALTATDITPGVSYSWSGPNGFASTLQNPTIAAVTIAASGTYTVTAFTGSCRDSSATAVVINPTPPVPILGTNAPVCSGTVLQLTSFDDSAAYTISWTGPNGFTSSLDSPTITSVTTAATGIYTAIATLGSCSAAAVVQAALVDSTPAPLTVTTPITICQYDTLYLTASTVTTGVLYNWTGPLMFSSTSQNPVLYNADTTLSGLYVVTASIGSCNNTANVIVTVNPIPVFKSDSSNGPPYAPLCEGGFLQLYSNFTDEVFGTFNWTGPNGFTAATLDPGISNVTLAASGVYSVSETRYGCTSSVDTLSVLIVPAPDAPIITTNSPVCLYDTLKLAATDDSAGVTYSWSGPNSFTSTAQDPFITNVAYADSGYYQVIVSLGICKDSSTSQQVSITSLPTIAPANNGPICTGDTLRLYGNAEAGSTYSWAGPYNFSSLSPDPFIPGAIAEDGGVYIITAFLNGCYASAFDTVIINQTPPPPSVSWLTYCQYYPAPPLMANGTDITWYPVDTVSPLGSTTAPVPSTASVGSAFYFATQTINGCRSMIDSIKVTVDPKPSVTAGPADTAVCPHSVVVLTAVDTDAFAYYQWSPAMYLNSTNTASVTASPETSQSYTVVASNQFGCADTASVSIKVYPAAVVYLGDSVELYPGETYTMNPSTNCTSFTWFPPAGLSSNTIPNPVASPAVSTKYIVYGQTENGCTTADSISIYLATNSLIALPNAFTPGNGPNNEFKLIKKGVVTLNYFRIFNRWGQKVFETTDLDAGWDGTFNGTPQPLGVYVYEIGAATESGQSFLMQGNLTLLR